MVFSTIGNLIVEIRQDKTTVYLSYLYNEIAYPDKTRPQHPAYNQTDVLLSGDYILWGYFSRYFSQWKTLLCLFWLVSCDCCEICADVATAKLCWHARFLNNHIVFLVAYAKVFSNRMSKNWMTAKYYCSQIKNFWLEVMSKMDLTVDLADQKPVSQAVYELKLQTSEISFSYNFDSTDFIRSQVCTCLDSSAVMACAKFWPDLFIVFHGKVRWILLRFEYMRSWTL